MKKARYFPLVCKIAQIRKLLCSILIIRSPSIAVAEMHDAMRSLERHTMGYTLQHP